MTRPQTPADQGPAVLVADDDPVMRRLAEAVLGRAGYRVLLAADGAECREVLAREAGRLGAVVIDLMMRGLGGRASLPALRGLAPGVPFLLAGGSAFRLPGAAGAAGMEGYVAKPYDPDELRAAVAAALAGGARPGGAKP